MEARVFQLCLIRHGMTEGNKEQRYIGRTDEPLCDEGKEIILKKKYPTADKIFTSPLLRCQQTAELIYFGQDYTVVDALMEMNFGEYEGKNYKDLSGDKRYQNWIDEGGKSAFPDGESRADFINRTMAGMNAIIDTIKNSDLSSVSVVAHGGTIMAVLSEKCSGEYFDYHVENGGYYMLSIELSENGWKVLKSKRG